MLDAGIIGQRVPGSAVAATAATATGTLPRAPMIGARDGRPRSRRRTPKREEEVLAAATKIFHERGYTEGSLQGVADELGIRKGSLYHYIDTKEDLLFALLSRLHAESEKILDEVLALKGLLPLERLALYVRSEVALGARQLPLVSVYCNDLHCLGEERRRELVKRRKIHERFVVGLIEAAQAEGAADRSLDPRALSNCVFGTFMWTFKCHRPGGKISRDELASVCAWFVRSALLGDKHEQQGTPARAA